MAIADRIAMIRNRIKGAEDTEQSSAGRVHRCSYCRQEGHNVRTCAVVAQDSDELGRLRIENVSLRSQNQALLQEIDRLSQRLARLAHFDPRYS